MEYSSSSSIIDTSGSIYFYFYLNFLNTFSHSFIYLLIFEIDLFLEKERIIILINIYKVIIQMGDESKAQQYWQEAEKKLKSSGSVFSSLFGYLNLPTRSFCFFLKLIF